MLTLPEVPVVSVSLMTNVAKSLRVGASARTATYSDSISQRMGGFKMRLPTLQFLVPLSTACQGNEKVCVSPSVASTLVVHS